MCIHIAHDKTNKILATYLQKTIQTRSALHYHGLGLSENSCLLFTKQNHFSNIFGQNSHAVLKINSMQNAPYAGYTCTCVYLYIEKFSLLSLSIDFFEKCF